MSMDLELDGFDDLIEEINKLDISKTKERKILKAGGEIIKEAMEKDIAVDTEKSKRSIKSSIRNSDEGLESVTKVNNWYYTFDEWGTSKNKKNVGKIEKAVDNVVDKVYKIASEEAFKGI